MVYVVNHLVDAFCMYLEYLCPNNKTNYEYKKIDMKKWTRPEQIIYPRLTVLENGQSLASANQLRVCVLEIACFVLNTRIIFLEHYMILFITSLPKFVYVYLYIIH